MYLGRRTTDSGTSHVDFGGVPVTVWSPLIATIDDMHATGMESSRFRYDDRRSERYHTADRKPCRAAVLQAWPLPAWMPDCISGNKVVKRWVECYPMVRSEL